MATIEIMFEDHVRKILNDVEDIEIYDDFIKVKIRGHEFLTVVYSDKIKYINEVESAVLDDE